MKVKEESEKVDLKLNIQEIKTMASGPITSWQIWGNNKGQIRKYLNIHMRFFSDVFNIPALPN